MNKGAPPAAVISEYTQLRTRISTPLPYNPFPMVTLIYIISEKESSFSRRERARVRGINTIPDFQLTTNLSPAYADEKEFFKGRQ